MQEGLREMEVLDARLHDLGEVHGVEPEFDHELAGLAAAAL